VGNGVIPSRVTRLKCGFRSRASRANCTVWIVELDPEPWNVSSVGFTGSPGCVCGAVPGVMYVASADMAEVLWMLRLF
jgi:hypothetical protein